MWQAAAQTNTSAYSLENGNNEFILPTEATGSDSPGMVTFVGAKVKAARGDWTTSGSRNTPLLDFEEGGDQPGIRVVSEF